MTLFSSLTIPGQLFIMPKSSPINIKVQNKNKEYLSIILKMLIRRTSICTSFRSTMDYCCP